MKRDIHPEMYDIQAHCACGKSFPIRSTVASIDLSICSNCHPFFTGEKNKFVDTAGRIEKFEKRFNKNAKK